MEVFLDQGSAGGAVMWELLRAQQGYGRESHEAPQEMAGVVQVGQGRGRDDREQPKEKEAETRDSWARHCL